MVKLASFLTLLALATATARARAEDGPATARPDPEGQSVREELARQAAEVAALRAEVQAARAAAPAPAPSPPSVPSEVPFAVRVSGFAQVDWVVHNDASQDEISASSGAPLNQDRFTLRRGHVRVEAEKGVLSSALEIDANTTKGPQVRPIVGEVSIRWPVTADEHLPTLTATAGLLQIPFGFEVREVDWVRPFLERATVLQALFPGEYDLGVRLRARYRFVDLAIAAMNGSPIGAKQFPAMDPSHQKDVVGRLGAEVDVLPGVRLMMGVSADVGTGFHGGTPTTKDVVAWQDQNGDGVVQPSEIVVIPGSPATPSKVFNRFAVGGDARVAVRLPFVGDLTLRGEVVSGVNLDRGLETADPVGAGYDLREVGWSVGATQELTRWGMIGARYDRYNPDADANQQTGARLVPTDRSYGTLALMGMVRYGNQRLLVEYDVNSNPLGLSPAGLPTTLASNALTLRAQVAF